MSKISAATAMVGANADKFADLLAFVDVSVGATGFRKIVVIELMIALGLPVGQAVATEAIAAGDLCNVYTAGGVAKIRLANATDDTKPANATAPLAIANTATGYYFGPGLMNEAIAGLTPGTDYFLHTTPGSVTAAQPSGSGNLVQKVGYSEAAAKLVFWPEAGITLA